MTALTSATIEVEEDPISLVQRSLSEGWGDGLPLIPPTTSIVEEFVSASGRPASESLGRLLPSGAICTVEKLAVNAVLAGAPPESMPLLCAAIHSLVDPAFDLGGLNVTTASVVPAIVVNGAARHELGIPFSHSVLGGMASSAPAIGRAIRLVMRNVAGQAAGETSESVFGQPGRVAGIVFGEWEERSPWPPFAERRGISGDAVTAYGTLGTCNVVNGFAETGAEILELIGKSLAYMGNNNFQPGSVFAQQMVTVNPIWADTINRDIPSFEDVREIVWENARLPLDWFPQALRDPIVERGRIDEKNRVRLMDSPEDLHLIVCGGPGNIHSAMLPGMSHTLAVTTAID